MVKSTTIKPKPPIEVPRGHMNTLGNRIKACRTAQGWSHSQLARAAGVSQPTVADWEDGTIKNLRPATLYTLADLFGVAARWLGIGRGEPYVMFTTSDTEEAELMEYFRNTKQKNKRKDVLAAARNAYLASQTKPSRLVPYVEKVKQEENN